MLARIFRPAKTAMQSGRGNTHEWMLEFEPAAARTPDPLMGWTSTSDMNHQVRMGFSTKEAAIAWAETHGIAFRLFDPPQTRMIVKTYADNFAYYRREPWTH